MPKPLSLRKHAYMYGAVVHVLPLVGHTPWRSASCTSATSIDSISNAHKRSIRRQLQLSHCLINHRLPKLHFSTALVLLQVANKRQQGNPSSTARPACAPLSQFGFKPKVKFGQPAHGSEAFQPTGDALPPWNRAPSEKAQWPTLDQQQQQHARGQQRQQPTLNQQQQQQQKVNSGDAAENDVIDAQRSGAGLKTSETDEKRRALAATPAFCGGQPSLGRSSPVQPSFGEPTFGRPSLGQPTTGQLSFGQPSFGQSMTSKAVLGKSTKFPPASSQPGSGALDNRVYSLALLDSILICTR